MIRTAGLLFVLAVVASLTCVPACSPPAVTPGYTLYRGNTEGLMISFEYPDGWRFSAGEPRQVWDSIFLHFDSGPSPIGSYIAIGSTPQTYHHPSGGFENAHDVVQFQIYNASQSSEFISLGSGKITLGKAEGEWVSYSVYKPDLGDEIAPIEHRHVTYRHVAVDYKGRIYWITLQVDTDVDKLEDYNPGFDHLLDTFKFLD